MTFELSPGPLLAYSPPGDGGHFITDWHWWSEVATNFALAGSLAGMVGRGRMLGRTVALLPNAPTAAKLVLPFTLWAGGSGLLYFALDVAFYKGTHPAFKLIAEQYRLLDEWLNRVDDATLRNALGPEEYAKLAANGQLASFQAVIWMPPAWLTDP